MLPKLRHEEDIETREELGDGTTLVFIEMNKFRKQLQECQDWKERWLCSMKTMNAQLEIPEEISGTELEELYCKGEIAALPKSKKLNYISYIMSRNDELNSRAGQIADYFGSMLMERLMPSATAMA